MNINNKITTLLGALSLLTACSDELTPTYTVGEADNAIVLQAGVMEGASGVMTRALNDETNHAKHTPFAENTVIALRMDGHWTGHSPVDVKKKTIATLGAAYGDDNKHNLLTKFSPVFYWDDYGTADPNNADGRDRGLDIFGVAINGVTDASNWPSPLAGLNETQSTWKDIAWTVETNQKDKGIINSDLLTSNNVIYNAEPAASNSYQFVNKADGKLLVFTHAMSKITVVLTAGEGFPRMNANNANSAVFQAEPAVTLKGFYNSGTVDVETKTSTPTTSSTPDICMHRETTATSWTSAHEVTFEAIVFPGNTFENSNQILTLSVDGNSFNVTAAKLNEAIQKAIDRASGNTATADYPTGKGTQLLQAWNYKLQITVNKTALGISATIENWNEVTAKEEAPKININETYGHDSNAFTHNFDFFRSTTKASGYTDDAYVEHNETAGVHSYTFHDPLYWPDHQTHYFFRGIYPRLQTSSTEAGWIPTAKVSDAAITVQNVAYQAGTYPSDLAFGWPKTAGDVSDDETCKVAGHSSAAGICATEGNIFMNFQYAMSKVQVSLKSSGTSASGNFVDLSHAVVEIIGGNNAGRLQFSDGKHDTFTAADKGNYTLHTTTAEPGYALTTLDAIVPQTLSNDVKLRITVKDAGGNVLDVYEAQLNLIKDASSNLISEWKPGNYYKYQLDVLKTAIKVTATLKDWVPVEASENVWF